MAFFAHAYNLVIWNRYYSLCIRTNKSGELSLIRIIQNRHYILDLVPEVSIVRNLLTHGLDVYATDWITPSSYDKDLTLGHFVNDYLDRSVDFIRQCTKSDEVSLLGYCWGRRFDLNVRSSSS